MEQLLCLSESLSKINLLYLVSTFIQFKISFLINYYADWRFSAFYFINPFNNFETFALQPNLNCRWIYNYFSLSKTLIHSSIALEDFQLLFFLS